VICSVLECEPSKLLIHEPDKVAARRPGKAAAAADGPDVAKIQPRLGRNRTPPPA
jgi:putative transcriptional regulator